MSRIRWDAAVDCRITWYFSQKTIITHGKSTKLFYYTALLPGCTIESNKD